MAQADEKFKNSPYGQKLKKEADDLVKALKQNVKVTDVPKEESLNEDDQFDLDHEMEMLRVTVSKHGQKKIGKEAEDVKQAWQKVEHTKPVADVRLRFAQWLKSPEVAKIKALDQKFLTTPRGKQMMKEWKEFAVEIKAAWQGRTPIHKPHKDGFYINNQEVNKVAKEGDDVAQQYKNLKGTQWEGTYRKAYTDALESQQAKNLE